MHQPARDSVTPIYELLQRPNQRAFWDQCVLTAINALASRKAYTGTTAIRFPDDLIEDAILIASAATERRDAYFSQLQRAASAVPTRADR